VPAEQVPAESDEVEQFAAAPVDLLRGHQAELARSGRPLWNSPPLRSRMVHRVASAFGSTDSASRHGGAPLSSNSPIAF
jgi:hypothetical protein